MAGKDYFIGVDVGTQSVRAGLISPNGSVISLASEPIKTWNPKPDIYEQSSDMIWKLCINVIKQVTKGISPASIRGIGFDATCSLVVLDKTFLPVTVSETGNQEQNIIVWMDHRAIKEADFINSFSDKVLECVGGKISPEMELPKLLWLKKNLPKSWKKASHFFDLPDFLTFKATESLQRSLCSVVCKWLYQAGPGNSNKWPENFLCKIGLDDFKQDGIEKIGNNICMPGEPCGNGLSEYSAKEMGLLRGTPVASSIIDAHAGGLGVLLCNSTLLDNIDKRMALICGTSTCHMKLSKDPIFTPGVWGPYYSVMVPNYWCCEAGQSAAGALLDHVINTHPATALLKKKTTSINQEKHIADILNEMALKKSAEERLPSVSLLTSDLHIYPDFHGNRSPLADPNLKGMISGLTLSCGEDSLVKLYVATLQALAYSTRHIITSLEEKGHAIKCLLVCGGLAKNKLYVQMHADITGLPVIVPFNSEPILVGTAILAASAAKYYTSVLSAMQAMGGKGSLVKPDLKMKTFHDKKYKAYLNLLKCQQEISKIMTEK